MYKVTIVWANGASVKQNPNTGGAALYVYPAGATFEASEIIRDNTDPNNADKLWARISGGVYDGKFVAVRYPSSSGNPVRATWEEIQEEEPTPTFPDFFDLVDPQGKSQRYYKAE